MIKGHDYYRWLVLFLGLQLTPIGAQEKGTINFSSGKSPFPSGSSATFFPDPPANSPENLVRTIVFIPDNRWPSNPTDLNNKIENMRSRIEFFYSFLDDYFTSEFQSYGVSPKTPNFERNTSGQLIIHPFHGEYDHNWYWGDNNNNGINGEPEDADPNDWDMSHLAFDEMFGQAGMNIYQEMEKAVVVIIYDCHEYLPNMPLIGNYPGWGGSIGSGTGLLNGSRGCGGYCNTSAVLLDYLPSDASGWQAAICDDTVNHPQTGGNPLMGNQTVGSFLSNLIGTFIHEFGHSVGLWHPIVDALDPSYPVMGLGWMSGRSAVRRVYNLLECSTSEYVPMEGAELRLVDCRRLLKSRFFNDDDWTDTTDPITALAWPRMGHIYSVSEAPYPMVFSGVDPESGLFCLSAMVCANMFFQSFIYDKADITEVGFYNFSYDFHQDFSHRNAGTIAVLGINNQGAQGFSALYDTWWYIHSPDKNGEVYDLVFVDNDASDDNLSKPEGSYDNPYQDIQTAINSAPRETAIILKPGTYSIDSSLSFSSQQWVNIVGYGEADEVILDGGGRSISIFESPSVSGCMIANMTLKNCNRAINLPSGWSSGVYLGNLIITDMAQIGINLSYVEAVKVHNCTFYNIQGIGAKINAAWVYERENSCFELKNNIFSNCQTAIEISDSETFMQPSNEWISHNLFYNCSTIMSGLSSGILPSDYPGHLDGNPLFVNAATGDFHLQDFSPAVWSGNPLFLDNEGTKARSRGALEYRGPGPTAAKDLWELYD